ncbi:MAG: S-layer homology domain-containing protein, partial [Clostridia bacterium]|nr:S-layer homology domain-containing protein [Clostridia bacterium]
SKDKIPEPLATISGAGNSNNGYIKDGYVYIINTKNVLYVYDISNLAEIKTVAPYTLGEKFGGVTDTLVEGNTLYAADYNGLGIVDITDKEKPALLSFTALSRPNGLCLDGETLYVGAYDFKTYIYDVKDGQKPIQLGAATMNSMVYGLQNEGNLIYCACAGGVYVVDPEYQFDTTGMPEIPTEEEIFGTADGEVQEIESPFDDTKSHWANEHIAKMSSKGYILGKGNNKFAPEDNITRAEFISIATRMATPAVERYKKRFSDVSDNAWYADYIETAYLLGLIPEEMLANKKVLPDEKITREEMAAITVNLMEYFGVVNTDTSNVEFTDSDQITVWSKPYVDKANSMGLINGMEDGSFAPKSPSTRAQVCKILSTGIDMTAEEEAEFIAETEYTAEDNTPVKYNEDYNAPVYEEDGRPVVFHTTDAFMPGELLGFYGEYITNPKVYIAGGAFDSAEPTENAIELEIVDKDIEGQSITCITPNDLTPGVFTAWIKNDIGYSAPIEINGTRLHWVDKDIIEKGDILSIFGRNFAQAEFGGELKTGAALVGENGTYDLEVIEINPFRIKASIPNDVPNGDYEVYVSNDGVIWNKCYEVYGKVTVKDEVYDPYDLNQPWADEFEWDNKIDITKAPYNADNTGKTDNTEVIQKAIDDAHTAGGGIVYFPEGEYKHAGLQMDSKVILMGDGMEKSKLIYSYKGEDITGKQMIGTKGQGKIDGKIGFMNMGFFLDDAPDQGTPDTYFWLGEDWGANITNQSLKTAKHIFIKGCKLYSPLIRPEKKAGRALGIVVVAKSHVLFEDNICYGSCMTMTSCYISKYFKAANNHFTTATHNLAVIATQSVFENNVMNRNWKYGTEVANTQGIFMRGYSYVAGNTIRNTGMPGGNDGELVCTEAYRASTRMSGQIVSATKNSVVVNEVVGSDGKATGSETAGWYMDTAFGDTLDIVIVNGRGLGQRRRVASIDEATKTINIEGEWEILPDSTSKFVFAQFAYGATIYNNYANTGAKGLWLYGDTQDCAVTENNLIDVEGVYIHTVHVERDGFRRFNPGYFNRLGRNRTKGHATKTNVCGVGVNAGIEYATGFTVSDVLAYGIDMKDNVIIGTGEYPESISVTEAPDLNGMFATTFSRQQTNTTETIMKGVIIENNRVEKMDRGITVGNDSKNWQPAGTNMVGSMQQNIVLKGNTFSEVQREIVDVDGIITMVE